MSQASELTNQIIDHIYRLGGFSWRATTTGLFDERTQRFRMGSKKGVSDILAVIPYKLPNGKVLGRLCAIEVKIGKDRMRPEQVGFFKNVEHAGGLTFIAKDFESFQVYWDKVINSKA